MKSLFKLSLLLCLLLLGNSGSLFAYSSIVLGTNEHHNLKEISKISEIQYPSSVAFSIVTAEKVFEIEAIDVEEEEEKESLFSTKHIVTNDFYTTHFHQAHASNLSDFSSRSFFLKKLSSSNLSYSSLYLAFSVFRI